MNRRSVVQSIRRPILVTGMARSGTSWVGRMLCASGEAGYLDEPFNLATAPGTHRLAVEFWYPYLTTENEHRLVPALTRMLRFKYPLGRELARCRTAGDLRRVIGTWRTYARHQGRRPLVKEPHAVFSAEWFARRLQSDIVVTVRHPAAVVSSWKQLNWSFDFMNLLQQPPLVRDWLHPFEREMQDALAPSQDLVDRVALLWRVIYTVVGEFQRRYPEFHIIRHEELSCNPLAAYAKLYNGVGLRFTSGAAEVIAAGSDARNPKGTDSGDPHAIRLDSRASLHSWKGRLSSAEIARIRRVTEAAASPWYDDSDWM